MEIIQGKAVSGGMAYGKIFLLGRQDYTAEHRQSAEDPQQEILRFREGCRALAAELDVLYSKTLEAIGESEAEIFSLHRMMLEEDTFTESVEEKICQGISASDAVLDTGEAFAAMFAAMDNPYMQARDADIRSIARRLHEILEGRTTALPVFTEPVILAAEDLTPAQTVDLKKDKVLGFITARGSTSSHTAILARTLGIPAVTAAGTLSESLHGLEGILDGEQGTLYVDPDRQTINRFEQNRQNEEERKARWETMRGHTCRTREGKAIRIYANAGSLEDAAAAAAGDAEGIGLFRSEFLFMQYGRNPTEEEQYNTYREVLAHMPGKEVIIRTLDAGADKQIPWLPAGTAEANPALGLRAIRLCLRYPELLRTQLRAMYRAAVHGKLCAMIPMITLPSELEQVHAIAEEVRRSLEEEKIPFAPDMPLGIMIETPSAALCAGTLAEKSAFFSIGTNDLTQYTMAADRENGALTYLTETIPESVKRLILMTTSAATAAGIPVSVCGELAGEEHAIPFLVDAGVDKLSVSPGQVLKVRSAVQRHLDTREKAE